MSIEFACPGCQQTLRVPQTAAGKVAKCPSCSMIATVPTGNAAAHDEVFARQEESPKANPFAEAGSNPYGGETIQPYRVAVESLNPYASPSSFDSAVAGEFGGHIGNRQVTLTAIWNESFALWQQNLGLLVGATLSFFLVAIVLQLVYQRILRSIGAFEQDLTSFVPLLLRLGIKAIATFLTVGQTQMCLKMCRRQHVEFADLFRGGPQYMPALLVTMLVAIPDAVLTVITARMIFAVGMNPVETTLSITALSVLVALVFYLLFWPYLILVIDEKASVLSSFGMAFRITEGNRVTSFLMWLCSILITIAGIIACVVGIVAAYPLLLMMQSVAYLMMSGQMPPEGYRRT